MFLTRARIFSRSVFHLYFVAVIVLGDGGKWSPWFDTEQNARGDNQTLSRIQELYGYNCAGSQVEKAECREKSSNSIFSNQDWFQDDYLRLPCDSSGVLCAEGDQDHQRVDDTGQNWTTTTAWTCMDYEIRFLCRHSDTTDVAPKYENPLNVNGGFIAMAAGLSVVLPLICVLIIQLRKARREERERTEREVASGGEGGNSSDAINDPPPQYDQLFGSDCDATPGALHTRANSMDGLIEEGMYMRGGDGGGSDNYSAYDAIAAEEDGLRIPSHPGHARNSLPVVLEDHAGEENSGGGQGRADHGLSSASLAMIPRSQVADATLLTGNAHTVSDSSGVESSMTETDVATSSVHDTCTEPSSVVQTNSTPSTPNENVTTANQLSTSNQISSTSPISSSPSSSPNSSPPTYSPVSSSTNQTSLSTESIPSHSRMSQTSSAPTYSPPATPPPSYMPWRRLPGMHVSIQEFFSNLVGGTPTEQETEPPPPSYVEALAILEKAKLEQEKFDNDHK